MRNVKSKLRATASATLLGLAAGTSWAGTEGGSSTYYGAFAGALNGDGSGYANVFIGRDAGYHTTTGAENVYVGSFAGQWNVGGHYNVAVGRLAGYSTLGNGNVFLGYGAGYNEPGSSKLYIDNCSLSVSCTFPLVYGEFDNRLVKLDGVLHVTAHRSLARAASQLHFSVTGADTGGWLTSAGDNNFFTSSGARYDGDAGGWIQRSPDGKTVIAGSGGAGYRILTADGTAVGAIATPVSRLHLDYAGNLGLNTPAVAGKAIASSTGAYLSTGGAWVNASSRALKKDIAALSGEDAARVLDGLQPVTFRYLADEDRKHVGFIAEDVPELLATADRKGLSALDVVAVLAKVVQAQKRQLEEKAAAVDAMAARLDALERRLDRR